MTTLTASPDRAALPQRAVLWDLDGTLVDSEPLHRRTLYAVLAEAGCQHPPDLDALLVGLSIDKVHALLRERFGLTLALDDFARRRAALFVAQARTVPARPGAVEIVAALSARGVPQAIVSNSDGVIVRANVLAAGLDRYGIPAFSRDDVINPKPHPEPYLSAARTLGVEAGQCVVVEDSLTGVLAGIAAGCPVLAWADAGSTLVFPLAARRYESAAAVRAALDAFLAAGIPDAAPSPGTADLVRTKSSGT